MNSVQARHPSDETLSAFVNGQLDDDEQKEVEAHVLSCERCVEFLRTVPEDDLLRRIRSTDTSTRGDNTRIIQENDESSDSASFTLQSQTLSSEDILAELADHPRYRIVNQLGAGGMGIVYRAEHRVMERPVAIKVIAPRLMSQPNAVERFQQEVKAAAKLSHRNIVAAYDAEQVGELHYLVMEYVEGISLDQVVKRHGALPIKRACYYIWQAAQGLQHAHENGMVHRDIKPQNLMCAPDGVIKILDFGLARLAADNEAEETAALTAVGMTVGTPDYMSPEQARNSRSVDARADIYSLGCTFYFLLTGQPPFPVGSALEKVVAHLERQPASARQLRKDIPQEVLSVLERMLEKDPDKRYQTPAEVAEALKPLIRKTSEAATPAEADDRTLLTSLATLPDVSRRPNRRKLFPQEKYVLAALVGFVLLSLSVWWFWPRNDKPSSNNGHSQSFNAVVGDWVNLIHETELPRIISGRWQNHGGWLTVKSEPNARLAFGYQPPAEYDFEVSFTRETGQHSIALIFVTGDGQATFEVDAWGDNLTGFQNLDGQSLRTMAQAGEAITRNPITNGQQYTIMLEVRKTGVKGYLDGDLVATYHGNGSNLSLLGLWDLWDPKAIGIGAYEADTTFHRIRIRPVNSGP